jgi:hypothetical protein
MDGRGEDGSPFRPSTCEGGEPLQQPPDPAFLRDPSFSSLSLPKPNITEPHIRPWHRQASGVSKRCDHQCRWRWRRQGHCLDPSV